MTRPLKPNRYKRMTLRELEPFVAQYQAQFPGWKRTFPEAFGREAGPVAQEIWFERLSTGDYRPTSCIRIFPAPSGRAFHQDLNVKVRQVRPREHEYKFPKVLEAIHKEIIPPVDEPLIPEDVLERFESMGPHNSPEAHDLAALNAYLGHDERAMYWCHRFPALVDKLGGEWMECDHGRHAFLQQLEKWIKNGEAKLRLEEVIQSERTRLHYA